MNIPKPSPRKGQRNIYFGKSKSDSEAFRALQQLESRGLTLNDVVKAFLIQLGEGDLQVQEHPLRLESVSTEDSPRAVKHQIGYIAEQVTLMRQMLLSGQFAPAPNASSGQVVQYNEVVRQAFLDFDD